MSVHFTVCDKVDQFGIFDDSIHLEFLKIDGKRISGMDFEFNIGTGSARKMLDPEYLFTMIFSYILLPVFCTCMLGAFAIVSQGSQAGLMVVSVVLQV
jgi:hypothetical protein